MLTTTILLCAGTKGQVGCVCSWDTYKNLEATYVNIFIHVK